MRILINEKEKALVDGDTGEIMRPNCWFDLIPYIRYVEGRGHPAKAQELLQAVFRGDKIITRMIEASQKRGITGKLPTYPQQ